MVNEGEVSVEWVEGAKQLAHVLTKQGVSWKLLQAVTSVISNVACSCSVKVSDEKNRLFVLVYVNIWNSRLYTLSIFKSSC